MPTKSGIIGTVKIKMEDGTFVDFPGPISLEEITAFAEQYEFVRVVRCKDCEWWREGWSGNKCCELTATNCESDHYCGWAERRENEPV